MLQAEKAVFADFTWYSDWVEAAKQSELLTWLNQTRVEVVHQKALAPRSYAELHCLEPDTVSVKRELNPFVCTHVVVAQLNEVESNAQHGHRLVRTWEIDTLPDRELLAACAEMYGRLDDLDLMAHQELGDGLLKNWDGDVMPCMLNTSEARTALIEEHGGRAVWINQPRGLENYG